MESWGRRDKRLSRGFWGVGRGEGRKEDLRECRRRVVREVKILGE